MKRIIILLLFLPILAYTQAGKCDSGYTYLPSMTWDYHWLIADTCVPDSTYRRVMKEWNKMMCEGMGFFGQSDSFRQSNGGRWIDDSCQHYETYERLTANGWIDIPECEYYYLNNSCVRYSLSDTTKLACCGHLPHTFNPRDTANEKIEVAKASPRLSKNKTLVYVIGIHLVLLALVILLRK